MIHYGNIEIKNRVLILIHLSEENEHVSVLTNMFTLKKTGRKEIKK